MKFYNSVCFRIILITIIVIFTCEGVTGERVEEAMDSNDRSCSNSRGF